MNFNDLFNELLPKIAGMPKEEVTDYLVKYHQMDRETASKCVNSWHRSFGQLGLDHHPCH